MNWARILAYVTGTVDQELLLRNEYLAAENRICRRYSGRALIKATGADCCGYRDGTAFSRTVMPSIRAVW
jgi:hypothetical protein